MLKKILTITMALLLVFAMVGCSNGTTSKPYTPPYEPPPGEDDDDDNPVAGDASYLRLSGRTVDYDTIDIITKDNLAKYSTGKEHKITVFIKGPTAAGQFFFQQGMSSYATYTSNSSNSKFDPVTGSTDIYEAARTFTWAEISEEKNIRIGVNPSIPIIFIYEIEIVDADGTEIYKLSEDPDIQDLENGADPFKASKDAGEDPPFTTWLRQSGSPKVEVFKPGSTIPDVKVSIASIPGISTPVTSGTPAATVDSAQYSGTVAWAGTLDAGKFAPFTQYTATISLTAKDGFTFDGVAANFFSVGAANGTSAAGAGKTLTVTVSFPATGGVATNLVLTDFGAGTEKSKDGATNTGGNTWEITAGWKQVRFDLGQDIDPSVYPVMVIEGTTTIPFTFKTFDASNGGETVSYTQNFTPAGNGKYEVAVRPDGLRYIAFDSPQNDPVTINITKITFIKANDTGNFVLTAFGNGDEYSKDSATNTGGNTWLIPAGWKQVKFDLGQTISGGAVMKVEGTTDTPFTFKTSNASNAGEAVSYTQNFTPAGNGVYVKALPEGTRYIAFDSPQNDPVTITITKITVVSYTPLP